MDLIQLRPIGIIHSPFKTPEETPKGPHGVEGVSGTVEVFPEYREGLADLDGFSHIMLVFYMHRSQGYSLKTVPHLDDQPRGLFATRAPRRPNPIGISVVRLDRIDGTTLHVLNPDIVDGTPLLDIKPYIPEPEDREGIKVGWLTDKIKPA